MLRFTDSFNVTRRLFAKIDLKTVLSSRDRLAVACAAFVAANGVVLAFSMAGSNNIVATQTKYRELEQQYRDVQTDIVQLDTYRHAFDQLLDHQGTVAQNRLRWRRLFDNSVSDNPLFDNSASAPVPVTLGRRERVEWSKERTGPVFEPGDESFLTAVELYGTPVEFDLLLPSEARAMDVLHMATVGQGLPVSVQRCALSFSDRVLDHGEIDSRPNTDITTINNSGRNHSHKSYQSHKSYPSRQFIRLQCSARYYELDLAA